MILLKSAIAGAVTMAAATQPVPGCYTSAANCAGMATFHNFQPSTNCASVRSPGGVFNFCVPGNGSVDKLVPPLSRFCWSGANMAPQTFCNLQWIYVFSPSPPNN